MGMLFQWQDARCGKCQHFTAQGEEPAHCVELGRRMVQDFGYRPAPGFRGLVRVSENGRCDLFVGQKS